MGTSAHDEVLDFVSNDEGHSRSNQVHKLRHAPIQVQQNNATESQW